MIQLLFVALIIAFGFWYVVGDHTSSIQVENQKVDGTPASYVGVIEESRNVVEGATAQENNRIQEGLK